MKGCGAFLAALAVGTVAGSGCGDADALVVHSPLPSAVLDVAHEAVRADLPETTVRMVHADPEETLEALRRGDPVDVWWGAPARTLAVAADEGLLAEYVPRWWDSGSGPDVTPAASGLWHPTLVSPFVIAFDRERLALSDAPSDWVDLFHYSLWGEVALLDPERSPEMAWFMGSMVVEALRDDDNLTGAFDWLGRLDRSAGGDYAADTDEIVHGLGSGDALVTILPRYDAERARHDGAPWLHYRLPESGTPLLALGVAIAASAAHAEAARSFVEVTGRADVATAAAMLTHWTPVVDIEGGALPAGFELTASGPSFAVAADTLARALDGWIERWHAEVRGRGGR